MISGLQNTTDCFISIIYYRHLGAANDMKPEAILIAGPTASGKSAVALALAQEIGGGIVNADSMQVYRDLRSITARPSAEEETRVPHRMYGHVDAAETSPTCAAASCRTRSAPTAN